MPNADFVTIASDALTARINPTGAELSSLADADGREWMTDGDPAFWTGRAPLLFPIVGALVNDTLTIDGAAHAMAKHGFARRSLFECVAHDAASARFRLTDSAQTRASYPFAFTLDVTFRLDGAALMMEATVSNTGDGDLPFSFGFHPAFAWPLPGGGERYAHRIAFAEPQPQPVRRVEPASGLLLAESELTPVKGRNLALHEDLFTNDALIWTDVSGRALAYGAEGGGWLDVAFPDMATLGLWQVPGARYICIEPWQGHADPMGYRGDFRDKPGIVTLAPGASRSFRMDVTVRPG